MKGFYQCGSGDHIGHVPKLLQINLHSLAHGGSIHNLALISLAVLEKILKSWEKDRRMKNMYTLSSPG